MIDRKRGFFDEAQETMPPEKREAFERKILFDTVRHAYENAPATRRKMDDAGVKPADVRVVSDLAKIPLTRKADLKTIQKSELPFGGLAAAPPRAMRRIYVSPGPTYDPEGREESHWRWEKAFIAAGFRPGDIVQNTFMYHFSPAGLMFDEALLQIGCTVIPAGVGNTEMQAQVMRDLCVTGYVGTPSFLMTVLEKGREMGIVPGNGLCLQVALVAAEMLPESLRGRFQEEFGIQVRQAYGTADAGSLGYECFEGHGMHIPDEILLELVDPVTEEPVAPGKIGEVVVTLPNETYPLVRFATGDLSVFTTESCPCGRTSGRLLRIVGRIDQLTKVKGIFVHPEQVGQIEKKIPEADVLQLVITRVGHEDQMTIQVVLKEGATPSEEMRTRISETAREVTRLRGEVVFVNEKDLSEKEKKIVDNRKWE
ncbi:MAG: AMP-binding protein [Deltaproteobacteria bacterium]|nr:AMP-binding protein [Deltaproteobacteria bacterium]NNG46833.1 AMP-binding protein [Deltaproteobacteria bacterium]